MGSKHAFFNSCGNGRKKVYIRKNLVNYYKNKENIPKNIYLNKNFIAPKNLSLIDNPVETVDYFNDIIEFAVNVNELVKINFDLSKISNLTIDVVMYMIALSTNLNSKSKLRYTIIVPKKKELQEIILSSGIERFFNTNELEVNEKNNIFTIKMGNKTDVVIAREICDFTNNILRTDLKYSKFLYDMLIEMMTNTGQHAYNHAYNKGERIHTQWFIFAENSDDVIKYTFIDTGIGIPKTMSKYMLNLGANDLDHIVDIMDSFSKDEKLDAILLLIGLKKGTLRMRTNEPYRGKGLPEIYAHYSEERKTSNLKIISGGCHCSFDENERTNASIINLNDKFEGTLFYWEIDKKDLLSGGDENAL